MLRPVTFCPIGVIHSPFKTREGMPIQSAAARDVPGTIQLETAYVPGLKDLEGFSHLILLYHFHLSKGSDLQVIPFMDTEVRGVFATRAPKRPNPIGLSIVWLERIEGNLLHILDVDVVDRTPLLDIKPYVTRMDVRVTLKEGWLTQNIEKMEGMRSDSRFVDH